MSISLIVDFSAGLHTKEMEIHETLIQDFLSHLLIPYFSFNSRE